MKKQVFLIIISFFYVLGYTQTYIPGETYFGNNNYIEYKAGNLPIVISAPHGGSLEPADIPDRDCSGCVYVTDSYTEDLVRQMYDAIHELFGCYPHVIINKLKRTKLDANRDIGDAADGNALAEQAWYDFHNFIDNAKDSIEANFGKGIYIDIHGHGHSIQRLELGYRLTKSNLQLSNSALNQSSYIDKSSIRNLVYTNLNNFNLAELLRDNDSFGEYFQDEGYPAIPSKTNPYPKAGESYFSGGYNTERHGSKYGGTIDGIQIECNRKGVRDSYENREKFSVSTAKVLKKYLEKQYFGKDFLNSGCGLTSVSHDIAALKEFDFSIFPNPVNDYINVDVSLPFQDHFSVSIVNQLGQIVYQNVDMNASNYQIPFWGFAKGIYFIKVESRGFTGVKKIIN